MPEPRGHRFAVVILSTESREPKGFLSRFPDGGRPRILAERMGLWLCDADRGAASRLATLARPAEIQSGFTAWVVGWDPPGGESAGVYVEVSGHRGPTSDAPVLRWMLRFSVDPEPGSNAAVLFLPNEALRPPAQGPLKGGREIQVSLGTDTIAVRADTRREWAPLFRVDQRSGAMALLPGAAPLGVPSETRAPRAPREPRPEGLMVIHPAVAPRGPRAAPAIWCDSLQLFLRQFASSPIRRGNDPYVDPLAVRPLPACSVELTAPWTRVDPRRTPWESLGAWLSAHGFSRDPRYDGNDPDSRSALYRRGDRFCAYAASWWTERPGTAGAPAADGPAGGQPPAEKGVGGSTQGPPTRYRLAVWSGVSR